jgi:hypothetical protein
MTRVAIATCVGDDVDVDTPFLLEAFARAGVEATMAVWDDERVDWDGFDATVVRSTWDYAPRRAEFLAWAARVPRLFNALATLTYSSDKHYLADLAARGVAVVPSTFVEVGQTPHFPEGNFIVKPAVGAGSIDADRYGPSDHADALAHVARLHEAGRCALVQPYVESVDTEGERALIFVDGRFSHAMRKGAMLNTPADARDKLFRREQMRRDELDEGALRVALAALGEEFADLLYARVDLVRDGESWSVMELELVEPSLFLSFFPEAGDALVAGLLRRLG